jgi:hypothetical protein
VPSQDELRIEIDMNISADQKSKTILKKQRLVLFFLSLNPEIEKRITFNWK